MITNVWEYKHAEPKNLFYLFLLAYFLIWGIIPALILTSVHLDSAENLALSHVLSWSYSKHPPLGMVILSAVNGIICNNEWSVYLLGALCMSVGLLFLYRIALMYMAEEEAIAASIISSMSYYFLANYVMQYNQNTILLPFWLAGIYYFLKVMQQNQLIDWLLLAVMASLSVLAKYESLLILGLSLIYLLFNFNKMYLKGFFSASILFFILLLPHFIWLQVEHFKTINYAFSFLENSSLNKSLIRGLNAIIVQPANFILCFLFSYFAIKYKLLRFGRKSPYENVYPSISYFAFAPWFVFIVLAFFIKVQSHWGLCILSLWIVAIFYYYNMKVLNIKSLIYIAIVIQLFIFIVYGFAQYFDSRIHSKNHPSYQLAYQAKQFWTQHNHYTRQPCYVGGDVTPALYLTAYYPGAPVLLKNNDLAYSTWIKKEKFSGAPVLLIDKGCQPKVSSYQEKGFKILDYKCINVDAANKYRPIKLQFMLYKAIAEV